MVKSISLDYFAFTSPRRHELRDLLAEIVPLDKRSRPRETAGNCCHLPGRTLMKSIVLLLATVGICAALVPALRAGRINPVTAIRHD